MVFTCIESVDKLKEIINCVEELVYERNELYKVSATQADITILPISQLRFLIVHIDGGEEPKVTQDFITSCESYCLTRVSYESKVCPTIFCSVGSLNRQSTLQTEQPRRTKLSIRFFVTITTSPQQRLRTFQ